MDHPNFSPLTESVKPPSQGGYEADYTRSTALKAALSYARRGQRVFPCRPDKSPLIAGGFKNATTDARKIHMWWSRWPQARIGLPTGEKFFVVDVDRLPALGELEAELPRTWTVETPRDGLHFYFAVVEGVTNSPGNLPGGIDVRGNGGYVIAPPSPDYKVIDRTPLAEAPEWLLDLIRTRRTPTPQPLRRDRKPTSSPSEPIPKGSRNGTFVFCRAGPQGRRSQRQRSPRQAT